MTSTGIFNGLNDGRKSSKVLKPPGGGSSDIFGSGPEETSPRRIKSHNQSQLGSTLFGETAPLNGQSSNGPETTRVTNKPDGNPVTGTGYSSDQQNNVMPVQNGRGNANSSGSEKSSDSSPGTGSMTNRAQRNRVPPGGYSSGLW